MKSNAQTQDVGIFALDNEPIAYNITIQYGNWRKTFPNARQVLEQGNGNIDIAILYFNLCSYYGKQTVDKIFLNLFDLEIGFSDTL